MVAFGANFCGSTIEAVLVKIQNYKYVGLVCWGLLQARGLQWVQTSLSAHVSSLDCPVIVIIIVIVIVIVIVLVLILTKTHFYHTPHIDSSVNYFAIVSTILILFHMKGHMAGRCWSLLGKDVNVRLILMTIIRHWLMMMMMSAMMMMMAKKFWREVQQRPSLGAQGPSLANLHYRNIARTSSSPSPSSGSQIFSTKERLHLSSLALFTF